MSVNLESAGLDRSKEVVSIANLNPICCKESDSISEVVDQMLSTGYRRLPVLDKKKKLVGILTTSDVLDAFLRKEDLEESVSTIMVRDVIFCDPSDTIGFVLQKFKLSRRGGFPIVKEGRVAGVITERDFVKLFSDVDFGMKIEELMTRKPFFISSTLSMFDSLKTLVNTHYRRLPVLEDKELKGIIASADLLRYIKSHKYSFDELDEPIDPIIIRDVFTISKEKDVSDAIKLMQTKDVGGALVVNSKLEGIITERDILEEIT